jgi:hypothetical protein
MMKKRFKRLRQRGREQIGKVTGSESTDVIPSTSVPRITNETIAEHREEVLAGARKYIYPLQHSKHRVVLISVAIFIVTIVGFFTYCTLALYNFQSTSTFIYRVTQVIPFPVARTGGNLVSYESYLFELRHYMHYYETQQKLSFDSEEGKAQLAEFKKRALERVVNDAYIKRLARENGVEVSNQEVDEQIAVVRSQNRLGNSDEVFENVLRDFWGWSLNDFKRSLRTQLLAQKVVSKLDNETHDRAEAAMAELRAGTNFTDVAKKYSDDPATKELGGEFPGLIDKTNRDLSALTTAELFRLQAGANSDIIDIGYALEIVRAVSFEGDKAKGAHIQFNFKDINEYLNPLKDESKSQTFLSV